MSNVPTTRSGSSVARSRDPFLSLRQRIDSLFDDMGGGFFGRSMAGADGRNLAARFSFNEPSVNVAETDKEYEITA